MKKTILSILSAISLCPAAVFAEEVTQAPTETRVYTSERGYRADYEHETHDGFYMLYSVASDGSAVFEGIDTELSDSDSAKLTIPKTLGGHTVKSINSAFPYNDGASGNRKNDYWMNITEIELPESVTSISDFAFGYMTHLEKINLPEGLTYLGDYLPNDRYEETELVLPKSLKKIGNAVFYGAHIFRIVLPDGLEEIGQDAFNGSKLTEVYLPDSVHTIGKGAFISCEKLRKLRIPDSLKSYEGLEKAFDNFRIREIEYNGEMTEQIKKAFLYTPYMRDYVAEHEENKMLIENGVLVLYGDPNKNAVIPEGVTEIGRRAFYFDDIITVSLPSTLQRIDMHAFSYSELQEIYIPASVKTIEQVAFYHCDDLQRVEFEDKGQRVSIGDSAFEFCPLEYVILPKNYNIGIFGGTDNFWDAVEMGKTMPRSTPKPVSVKTEATAAPEETHVPEKAGTFAVLNKNGNINISLNGEDIPFRTDKPFVDENKRTQVPLRAIMEYFGCNVSYDASTRTVEASKLGTVVTLTIGSPDMTINGETVKMDTAARIVNDRTYIPIRFVAEALGFDVVWK